MSQRKLSTVVISLAVLVFCLSVFYCPPVAAQTGENISELRQRILDLTKQTKYTEALPLLERIVVAEPDDAEMHFQLAFALIAQANITKDETTEKQLRVRARNEFIKSKALGEPDPLVDALIQSMSPDGSAASDFSKNVEANALMIKAEGYFSQGKMDEALKNYQKALELDPQLYHAALFAGDVFTNKEDFAQALTWYERAIAIDPTKETTYRYSATPLMKQGKIQALLAIDILRRLLPSLTTSLPLPA